MHKLFAILSLFSFGMIVSALDSDKFSAEALNAHNQYRFLHGVAPLKLNAELKQIAQQRANEMAQLGKLNSKRLIWQNESLGELVGSIKGAHSFNGISATQQWYSTVNKFDTNGILTKSSSSFSQMVWRTTTLCGFGIARDKQGHFYYVAEYWTKGNLRGQYDKNVMQISMRDLSECDSEAIEMHSTDAVARSLFPIDNDMQVLPRILETDEIKSNLNKIINSFTRNLLNTLQTNVNILKSDIDKSDALLSKQEAEEQLAGININKLLKSIPKSVLDKFKLTKLSEHSDVTNQEAAKPAADGHLENHES